MRAAALSLVLLLVGGCSLLLDPADDGCHARRVYGVAGSFPLDWCLGTSEDADRIAAQATQYMHVLEVVLAEHNLTPFGENVTHIASFDARPAPRDDWELAGQWDIERQRGHLWAHKPIESPSFWVFTAAPHELQHAYESLVLGLDWLEWHRLSTHFALGSLGSAIHGQSTDLWLATAWLCGDGGLDPPETYGGCKWQN